MRIGHFCAFVAKKSRLVSKCISFSCDIVVFNSLHSNYGFLERNKKNAKETVVKQQNEFFQQRKKQRQSEKMSYLAEFAQID